MPVEWMNEWMNVLSVCLYHKNLWPTEHIFMHFDDVIIFQFYLKWGSNNGMVQVLVSTQRWCLLWCAVRQ
jgi:hypothetical protein